MDLTELKDFKFYISLGYVVLISSILTIIIMEIIKVILKKKNIITSDMNQDKKDDYLRKMGKVVSLITYLIVYLLNEYFLHHQITFDEGLIAGILSGGISTLTVAKGLYTSYRQYQKKNSLYEKLSIAEKTITALEKSILKEKKIVLKGKEE